jgi:hypothetical protein
MTKFKANINDEEVFFEIKTSEAFFYSGCIGNIFVKDKNGVQRVVDKNNLENITILSHNFEDTTIYID